jgi:hypothetical protein
MCQSRDKMLQYSRLSHSKKVQGKVVSVLIKLYAMSGCIDPRFLDLSTSWRWKVSLTPRQMNPRGKSPVFHWIRVLVGPRAGLDDVEEREVLTLPELELRLLGHPPHSQSLYRLLCNSYTISAHQRLEFQIISQLLPLPKAKVICNTN